MPQHVAQAICVKLFVSRPCVLGLPVCPWLHGTDAISLYALCELHATVAGEGCQETDVRDDFCGGQWLGEVGETIGYYNVDEE